MDERTLVFIVLWALGLGAGFWMVRRGHDPRWIYLGALLGPLFLPIAVERVRNHPAVVGDNPVPVRDVLDGGLRVLVGYDGSPESRDAVVAARRFFSTGTLVLAQVVSYDAAEDESHADVDDARLRLSDAVAALAPGAAFEVLAGPPAEALCNLAREQDMDLLVVGPRGRGLSQRVLGSVADRVVKDACLPVLVAHGPGLLGSNARVSRHARRAD